MTFYSLYLEESVYNMVVENVKGYKSAEYMAMPSILSMLPSGEIHCALQEHDNDLLNASHIQICFPKYVSH